jgi:high-affinity nickel permease
MTLFYTAISLILLLIIPFIFLAVVIALVRHFERKIKKDELGEWRNEKL